MLQIKKHKQNRFKKQIPHSLLSISTVLVNGKKKQFKKIKKLKKNKKIKKQQPARAPSRWKILWNNQNIYMAGDVKRSTEKCFKFRGPMNNGFLSVVAVAGRHDK